MIDKELFEEKMLTFKKAFGELAEAWEKMDAKDSIKAEKRYPFNASFPDMYCEVVDWVETYISPKKKYTIGVYEIWEQMHEVEATSFEEACDLISDQQSNILEDQFTFVGFVGFDESDLYHLYKEE